ncbi:amidohydrolase [Niallia circulans]|uniref:Amidohydrolase n=1 Tax=Niallia circulans TaxID=1397 RepID=A0A553SPT5_NIACI|nr:amidohydrolase [Niallia circulans]TRZ39004.1 amidohydrolase [Niallia circulans]
MLEAWNEQLENMYEKMVEWRRHFHQYPELTNQEYKTSKMIADILIDFGIDIRTNVGAMGVLGYINGARPGKTIALRADFDALPIQDEKDVPYKSKIDGIMHACGHDGHTATLLAVGKVLYDNRDSLAGNVVLLFQHAEEGGGGAEKMIADNCLAGVDAVFANHLWSLNPTGEISFTKGYTTAAGDGFSIKIKGKGGHGSSPHDTVDSIAIAGALINQLQYIVSRRVHPQKTAVLTIGSIHAGNAANVIADSALMKGTVRTYEKEVQQLVKEAMEDTIKGICTSQKADYEFKYHFGMPAVYNHPAETDIFTNAIASALPEITLNEVPPLLVSEDFALYLEEIPGMLFFTGAGNEEIQAVYPHHHPKFDFDEKAMLTSGKAMLAIIDYYLAGKTLDNKAITMK